MEIKYLILSLSLFVSLPPVPFWAIFILKHSENNTEPNISILNTYLICILHEILFCNN